MKLIIINTIRNKLFYLNSIQIFILSFLICSFFYIFEGLMGIDRFYHPDSAYYLKPTRIITFAQFLENPKILIHRGYFILTHLLYDNYYFIIIFNFILYSLTNLLIYQKIFKRYFFEFNNYKLFILFYLLFLDPYRLHLASHILKETCIIFIIVTIISSNSKIIKLISILFLEIFRKNSWIYLLIYFTYTNFKKSIMFFNFQKVFYKKKHYFYSILITLLALTFFLASSFGQELLRDIYNFMESEYNKVFPMRSYDHVNQFKEFGFPIGFILKNITWPVLLITGLFIFFVSSGLFKLLGIVIIINHILVYTITKKTFLSFGLMIILIMLSVYTASFTSLYRYSYIALYGSLIYFFLNFNFEKKKNKSN